MNATQHSVIEHSLDRHPARHRDRLALHESLFALFGGPIAWFIQLCAGFALASEPCFSGGQLLAAPPPGSGWTWPAMIVLLAVGVLMALLSLLMSWRAFKRLRAEAQGDSGHGTEAGAERTRFLAIWGMLLGGGFAVATALTVVGFMTLPRCAG